MYKYLEIGDTFVVSIDSGCEVAAALDAFCREKNIRAGEITGLGAVCEATLRFFDPVTKQYVDRTFAEQMEIANLTGNVSTKDGQVYLHLHACFGRSDYTLIGGHLLTARIRGACELFVRPLPPTIGRRFDPAIGLNVYDL